MSNLSSLEEYLKSSVISFIAAFAIAVLPQMGDMQFTKAALWSLAAVGIRAGVKAVLELLALIKPTTSVTTSA